MKAILKQPGLPAEVIELEQIGLAELQHYCEGLVEAPYVPGLNESGVTLWANEEGVIRRMKLNLVIEHVDFYAPMPIVGPVLLTGSNGDGETVGLTEVQIEEAQRFLTEAQPTLRQVINLFAR